MKIRLFKLAALVAVGFLWTGLVFGPGHRARPTELDHSTLNPRPLTARALAGAPELGLPTEVVVLDSTLVLLDRYADHAVRVLRRSDGRLLAEAGPDGEGPGEFKAAWNLDVVPGNGAGQGGVIRVLDIDLQRLTTFEFADLSLRGVKPLPALGTATDQVELASGRIAAIGNFSGGRIAFLTAAGGLEGYGGLLPVSDTEAPTDVLLHAYQSSLEADPGRTRLAIATRHAGWLELYWADGTLLHRGSGPFAFEPRFEVVAGLRGPAMSTGPDLRFGYIDLATTDTHIYALFSGRLRGAYSGDAGYGRYVHVFDWNGDMQEVLELSGDAIAIGLDPSESQLYAIEHLPEPRVVVYDLKPTTASEKSRATGDGRGWPKNPFESPSDLQLVGAASGKVTHG